MFPWHRLVLVLLTLALPACTPQHPPPKTDPSPTPPTLNSPLRHEVYIWQTAWDAPVQQAIRSQASPFSKFLVLTTEMSWKAGKPQLRRTEWNDSTLAETQRDWGAVLRIGHQRALHSPQSETAQYALQEWKRLIQQTLPLRHAPKEYQIDYDCPERLLSSYAEWLKQWRCHLPPGSQLTITALPSWLDHADLPHLLKQCDGFVLQVHTLAPPAFSDPAPTLCNPSQALRWVDRANQFRKPFRVALPTYSYLAAYQPNGTFLGLSAEAPSPSWPSEAILRRIESSPNAMSQLVSTWSSHAPSHLHGILWFRLPVPTDQLNWPASTLQSVIQGTPLQPQLETLVSPDDSGLYQFALTNSGTCAAPFPHRIRIRGAHPRSLVASDAHPPYSVQLHANDLHLIASPTPHLLQPHQSHMLGWIRLSQPEHITADIPPANTPNP